MRGARGRAIYISSVNNATAAYPLATRSRDGPTGVDNIIIYTCYVRGGGGSGGRCRRPWAARRPIKTRRAGRAPRKSGATVTTIKWPRGDRYRYMGTTATLALAARTTLQRYPLPLPTTSGRRLFRTRATYHRWIYSGGPPERVVVIYTVTTAAYTRTYICIYYIGNRSYFGKRFSYYVY